MPALQQNANVALALFVGIVSCSDDPPGDAGQPTDSGTLVTDVGTSPDAAGDGGITDVLLRPDMGTGMDVGFRDGGLDAEVVDSSGADSGEADSGVVDSGTPDGGEVDSGTPDSGIPLIGLPYPHRANDYLIKAIQPDFWQNKDEIANHKHGGVAMNLVWRTWENQVKSPPCNPTTEQEYDNHCFVIDQGVDEAIRGYTTRGLVVTAIVYGVPAWARTGNTNCSPITAGFDIFCTPDNPADYGRFAGMLAQRYNGINNTGRLADFVIHNEVNANAWFDIGCGQGTLCDTNAWIQAYVDNYAVAYDQIKSHQSEAKVLLSFEHHFDTEYDRPADEHAMLSVKTFVTEFDQRIGNRAWQIAYHPYAPDLFSPVFGPLDLPRVTYGNLGVIVGWLRATFPNKPHTWEVQLTESGINSAPPQSNETAQAAAVCDSLRNVLGTPGITNYIYHRLRDNPNEGGLQLGLIRSNDTHKPSWAVWALANHYDDQPPQLDCGFEDLPYTRLRRGYKIPLASARVHWASSRLLPSDFTEETSWRLLRNEQPGTQLLFECLVESVVMGPHNLLTTDVGCEGLQTLGPVGYIWISPTASSVPLYRCRRDSPLDHFVSTDPNCEGEVMEQLLGHALP